MKKHEFRPTVNDSKLEDRVVLSRVSAVQVRLAPLVHQRLPVTNAAAVKATLTQIHKALVTLAHDITPALRGIQVEFNAGRISAAYAQNLASSLASPLFDQLQFLVRSATHRLPYGAGFNAYLLPPSAANPFPIYTALPSGGASLYARLTFLNGSGPIGAVESNYFNSIFNGTGVPDFNSAIASVSLPALQAAYRGSVAVTGQYILDGVANRDFAFRR